jgi:hypothetical protein
VHPHRARPPVSDLDELHVHAVREGRRIVPRRRCQVQGFQRLSIQDARQVRIADVDHQTVVGAPGHGHRGVPDDRRRPDLHGHLAGRGHDDGLGPGPGADHEFACAR